MTAGAGATDSEAARWWVAARARRRALPRACGPGQAPAVLPLAASVSALQPRGSALTVGVRGTDAGVTSIH